MLKYEDGGPMKASELIGKLQSLIDEYGDLDVMHSSGHSQYYQLEEIYYHDDVADNEFGVFQLTCDHQDRDTYA